MAIETICSGCGKKLSVADENAGKRARCPACGQIYTIPQPSDQTPSPDNWSPAEANAVPESAAEDTYWMRTADGAQYGPVDAANLNRWFQEGRVGPGYSIRQGQHGSWQSAEVFRAARTRSGGSTSGNPYADNPYQPQATPGASAASYPKADQGGLILAMGILAFFLCPIFGIVAWIMGHSALKDIQAGRANPQSKGLVQVGYYLGMASVILNLLCIGGYIVIIAVSILANA